MNSFQRLTKIVPLVLASAAVGLPPSICLPQTDSCSFSIEAYQTGIGPTAFEHADLNGDGIVDFVVANDFANSMSVLHGTKDGSFRTVQEIGIAGNAMEIDIGDIDGDGDLDAVVVREPSLLSNDTFVTLFNLGDGFFEFGASYGGQSDTFNIALGDVDSDGDLDVAVANGDQDQILIFANIGNGVFG